jgi:hypothetical protein
MRLLTCSVFAASLAACATSPSTEVEITDLSAAELPTDVRRVAEGAAAGFVVNEAQRKVRDGRTYYDVEGALPDGSEIEFDILLTSAGPEIVETQRDISWADAPDAVQSAAPEVSPARVIESTQANGTVIYELFAPGMPSDPAIEVALDRQGVARVLQERWPH